MRSVRLFRNEKVIRAVRPFWNSARSQNSTANDTKECQGEPDPYEGNYSFVECDQHTKVTVIGAAGRVGRTLSLLLKTCPLIDHLCLFDTNKSVKGVGADITHIDTKCCVSSVCGMRNIQKALDGPDVVVIAAGCPKSPQLSGKSLFVKNAPIVAGLSEACARFCPKACVVLITNPINSLLPVVGEVYQIILNRIPQKKLFGLTTLDVVRANTFVAEVVRKDPNAVIVPVIGGTSQDTIVPVISQMKPCCKIKQGELIALTECIKRAEGNLTDCQHCGTRGSSTLSTAYAAFRFTSSLVMALKGAENIIECAFVKSDVIPELEYMASPLKLGMRGVEYNFGYPHLSDYEVTLMEQAAPALIKDIRLGKCFVIEHQEKQEEIYRRCIPKKKANFFSACTQLPKDYCCQKAAEKIERKKEPVVTKRSECQRKINKACMCEPGHSSEPAKKKEKRKCTPETKCIPKKKYGDQKFLPAPKKTCRNEQSEESLNTNYMYSNTTKNYFLNSLWGNDKNHRDCCSELLGNDKEKSKKVQDCNDILFKKSEKSERREKICKQYLFLSSLLKQEQKEDMEASVLEGKQIKSG